jgi:hypothetical protein
LLSTDLNIPPLTFSASPDTLAVELVADLAARIAQETTAIDVARRARH